LSGNPPGTNPVSRDAEATLLNSLKKWKGHGIRGWTEARLPWFYLGEELGKLQAAMMGAAPDEIVVTSSTAGGTRPTRCKILADELNFPSDLYAMQSHLALRSINKERRR